MNLDFNSKLHGLVNELRGEIGATLRGSRDAKDRLLKSEFISDPKLSLLQSCSRTVIFKMLRMRKLERNIDKNWD